MKIKTWVRSMSAALALALLPVAANAQAVPQLKEDGKYVYRMYGDNRISTAIIASRDLYPSATKNRFAAPKERIDHVVLAGADAPADSATAIPLAVQLKAPILLVFAYNDAAKRNVAGLDAKQAGINGTNLNAYTRNEIERVLKPGGLITIVGGESAVSGIIEAQLRELKDNKGRPYNFRVRRLSGSNRGETSGRVSQDAAEENKPLSILTDPLNALDTYGALSATVNPSKVYAVPGSNTAWRESLVAGNIAGRANGMVVVGADGVRWAAANLRGFSLVKMGTWAANEWPENIIPHEVNENTDYRTLALTQDMGLTTRVAFATDRDFPDALVGAAHAARRGHALVLVDGAATAIDSNFYNMVKTYTAASGPGLDLFYGGPKAFTPRLAKSLAEASA